MSNNSLPGFERPLQLELKPSRTLYALYSGVHLLLLFAWSRLPVSPWFYAMLAAAVTVSWICHYRYFVKPAAGGALDALAWDAVRGWRVHRCSRGWRKAQLSTPVYVSRHLVVAVFKVGRFESCRAIVVADRLRADEFRRLRVRLLQSAHGS